MKLCEIDASDMLPGDRDNPLSPYYNGVDLFDFYPTRPEITISNRPGTIPGVGEYNISITFVVNKADRGQCELTDDLRAQIDEKIPVLTYVDTQTHSQGKTEIYTDMFSVSAMNSMFRPQNLKRELDSLIDSISEKIAIAAERDSRRNREMEDAADRYEMSRY